MGFQTDRRWEIINRNFLLLASSSFLYVMCSYLLVPMLPLYLGSMGVLETDIGFIIGLTALIAVLTRIPLGRFIDNYGRRGMLLFGIFLQSVTPFLYTLCTDSGQFTAVRALQGLGFAAFMVTSQTMVVDISPRGRLGGVLGIYTTSSLVAKALGPSLSGLLMSGLGYENTFYVAGGFGLAATIMALFIAVPGRASSAGGGGRFRDVLHNRNLLTASLALTVVMMPHGVVSSFFPVYAYGQGVGPEGIGLYFMVYAVCTGVVRPLVGTISDRVGRVAVAAPFAALVALATLSFSLAHDIVGFLVVGAMFGVGEGAVLPVLSALAVDTVPPQQRGQAVGVSGTATDLGITTGAMSMGPVIVLGGYAAAFLSTASIVATGMVAFLGVRTAWKREEKRYT